jgi:nitrogen fixation protein NifX
MARQIIEVQDNSDQIERGIDMKVAFSSSTGTSIDENFKKTQSFTVWDIGPREAFYVNTISIGKDQGSEDSRIAVRADALAHCSIVCSREINGPAAAKLVARNVHPMKTGSDLPVEEVIAKLQKVLQGNPPPWILKAQLRELRGIH